MYDLERSMERKPELAPAVERIRQERTRLEAEGVDIATTAAQTRYRAVAGVVSQTSVDVKRRSPWQHKLDRFLTHPVLGLGVLVGIFVLLFLVVFSWSGPAIDLVDVGLSSFGEWLGGLAGPGLLADFIEGGLVAGLGAFLVFVPQIAMLFVCIEALDDSGYLTRAAFLLDRVMGKAGLPGRALLPLVSGFACAIPGIMATRSISSRRERFLTIAILPLMSCQARLPVYAIIVGALFTQFGGWVGPVVVLSMYLLGILVALAGAKILKLTMLQGQRSPLMLELPPYRRPSTRTVLKNTARRTWSFVAGAGPIILAFSIVLWASLVFPRDVECSRDFDAEIALADAGADEDGADELRGLESAERLAHSWMGRAGKLIEPAIEPLGFDWKIGIAIIGSFAAREVFVPTLGVTYAAGEDADEESEGLLASMRNDRWPDGRKVFTPLVGISLLVFYVLALQCMSTLAIIKRETNSWRWPTWMFVGYSALAYLASLAVFQIGMALGFG
jgi:ferrous iron transport protein B